MGIQEQSSLLHWNYFLALEEDIEKLSRYIQFTESNFQSFSLEIAHIYLAACSEVDVVAKLLAKNINEEAGASNIEQYRQTISPTIHTLKEEVVTISRFGLDLRPWSNWEGEESPDWWKEHNLVKHHRHENFEKANLQNVLNAMAGLFLIILHYYKRLPEVGSRIEPIPSLFTPPSELASICPTAGGRMGVFYQ